MRTLSITVAAVAALAASQSFAQQDHAAHQPATPAPGATAEAKATADATPTHEMCKAVMGKQMDPRAVHEHSREKSGVAMWPNGKPPSEAEMEKMHKACAERMPQSGK